MYQAALFSDSADHIPRQLCFQTQQELSGREDRVQLRVQLSPIKRPLVKVQLSYLMVEKNGSSVLLSASVYNPL
jgi:hypothetical protein